MPLIGEDTDDKHETSSVALSKHQDILLQGKRSVAHRQNWYSSPLARDHTGQKAGDPSPASKVHSTLKDTFNNSSSNGS